MLEEGARRGVVARALEVGIDEDVCVETGKVRHGRRKSPRVSARR